MASKSSPCAACKFLQLNCTQECVFAAYFPTDQPHVRNMFEMLGASNVAKMLNRVSPEQRKYVANSLAYEAHMRLSDPLCGCFGEILELKRAIIKKRHLLEVRRRMLAAKVGPAAADAAFAAAATNAAAVAAAVAAAGGDAAAAVLLGHNVPNVFVPPSPFYHHPQQQQAYNYLAPVQMEDDVQMGGAVQWGAASGEDGMQMGDAVQMEDGVQIEDRVQWGAASGVQMGVQGGAASGMLMEDVQIEDRVQWGAASDVQMGVQGGAAFGVMGVGVHMGVGAVCGSDADEATAAACSGIAAACSELHSQAERGAR